MLVVSTLGVHLVAANDHLLDTHGEGKKSVLSGLSLLGPSSFELTSWGGDHENGDISLGGTSDHVLDEISVTWGINDGEDRVGGLELPKSDIDGDTSLTLGLELVKNPGILERGLSGLRGLLLELGCLSRYIGVSACGCEIRVGSAAGGDKRDKSSDTRCGRERR